MKKSFLLLAAGVIAAIANGQEAAPILVRSNNNLQNGQVANKTLAINSSFKSTGSNERNTSGTSIPCTNCGRWYDYCDSVLGQNTANLAYTNLDIWNDTTAIYGYNDGTYSATAAAPFGSDFTSIGLLFHPWASAWNYFSTTSVFSFPSGEIGITDLNSYTIDSLIIGGFYSRNPAKPTIVDTLIVQFVTGDGSQTGNLPAYLEFPNSGEVSAYPGIGTGNLDFISMLFDSVNTSTGMIDNRAGAASGAPLTADPWFPVPNPLTTGTYKFLLTINDTATTGTVGAGGSLNTVYPRHNHTSGAYVDPAINISVLAGYFTGVSVTFKSGDPALTHTFPLDTVDYASTTAVSYKYNSFSPLIGYADDGSSSETAVYPPYDGYAGTVLPTGIDWTSGYFNWEGARGGIDRSYYPNWGWTTGGGTAASALQYPDIWFHAVCPSCVVLSSTSLNVASVTSDNTVTAFPNPATDELNISYTLVNSSAVTISLTNMIGQVVATEKVGNATSGKVTFNTSSLSEGMYIYTFDADGARSTGRVVVAH